MIAANITPYSSMTMPFSKISTIKLVYHLRQMNILRTLQIEALNIKMLSTNKGETENE